MDNGASKHMSNKKECFWTMEAVLVDSKVTIGDNRTCSMKGIGSIPFVTTRGKETVIFEVLYVPSLCKNLLSVSQIVKHRMTILFEDGVVEVRSMDTGDLVVEGTKEA